jgi:uncharacterized protein (TIGR02118 family)
MVKLIFFCRRRPDITHQRYTDLLLNGHVPIALRHHPTMRKYVVNIVDHSAAGAAEVDSVGELSFATLDDFRNRLYDSPQGEEIVHRDVARFMGGAHSYATTEHVHKSFHTGQPGRRSAGVKLICPIRRLAGMIHAELVDHWLLRHVPLALKHHPGLSKYVTNVVDQRLSDDGPDWDGIAELHFASQRDFEEGMFDSAAGERAIRDDMARFIDHTTAYFVAEYVQLLGSLPRGAAEKT